MSTLGIDTVEAGSERTLVVAGELDLETEHELVGAVDSLFEEGLRTLALDLAGVTFIDSSGLRALLVVRKRADEAGVGLRIAGISPPVERLFDVAGVAGWFDRSQPPSAAAG